MKYIKVILLFSLIMLITYGAGQWLSPKAFLKDHANILTTISLCDPTKKVCQFGDKKSRYTLQFSQKPSVLTPFNILITASHPQLKIIDLSFNMESMDMGVNHYQLVESELGWLAEVILPVCSLGQNDWRLSIQMTFDNKLETTVFKFRL